MVDGNGYRFLARYFGIATPIDSSEGKKEFKSLAQELLDTQLPGVFNSAMMEFGSMQCKPVNPLCETCPFIQTCQAFIKGTIEAFPIKEKKTKVRTRYFHYLFFHSDDKVCIRQRNGKDIWKGLFEFPLIEKSKKQNIKVLMNTKSFAAIIQESKFEFMHQSEVLKHQLSHQLLITRFYHFAIKKAKSVFLKEECLTVKENTLSQYAMPQLLVKYLQEVGL